MPAARLLDHQGEWTPPFEITPLVTCRAADQLWDHRLFGISSLHPGDNAFQARTYCGARALRIPGDRAEVGCPRCLEYLAEDDGRA
jgi:hypothetical protein